MTGIIEGVTAVVNKIRAKLPESKLLLLAVFPRGAVDAPQRDQQVGLVTHYYRSPMDADGRAYRAINRRVLQTFQLTAKAILSDPTCSRGSSSSEFSVLAPAFGR